ncbi:MAG TPA: hydantoinase/oxoprolinase family protein [Actinomycetota bacterium]
MTEGWIIGVDVGGTFTDAIARSRSGDVRVAKVASTPKDPSIGFLQALDELGAQGVALERVGLLFHGTTIATNAVVTGATARVVLVSTEGFRDVMSYRSGSRPRLYDLEQSRPNELVPRRRRLEVRERLSSTGEVVTPLEDGEISRVVDAVAALEPEAVAVALLFSYLDDRHERALADALARRLPEVPVTRSSEVAREFREYPRTATAVANAALRPLVGRYMEDAEAGIRELGVRAPFLVMQSNGGCVPADRAEREAHRLLLSGPTAGVTGAVALGALHGLDGLISMDMGGTSLDVCLVRDGVPPIATVQRAGVHPILVPSVDIVTAGAGGGSIASVDRTGRLRVGPASAGADPGPAAYGLGGDRATFTDANVVTGVLAPDAPLAGRLTLDVDEAHRAVERVGQALGLETRRTAQGVVAVTAAQVSGALRRVSVERGVDPRDFTLVAFGGAGPLLAGPMLEEMSLRAVLVPTHPGLFSASGLLASSLRIDESQTVLHAFGPELVDELAAWYADARARLVAQLRDDGIPGSRTRLVATADCRYLGQGYELSVPLDGPHRRGIAGIPQRFHASHAATYGHADPSGAVEVVTVRLSAFGDLAQPEPPRAEPGRRSPVADAVLGERTAWLPGATGRGRTTWYRRDLLRAGNRIPGPAVIEQMDSTTLVLPGQRADVDAFGGLWIRREGSR